MTGCTRQGRRLSVSIWERARGSRDSVEELKRMPLLYDEITQIARLSTVYASSNTRWNALNADERSIGGSQGCDSQAGPAFFCPEHLGLRPVDECFFMYVSVYEAIGASERVWRIVRTVVTLVNSIGKSLDAAV